MKWGRSMFYETKLDRDFLQEIENNIKRFLVDNFDQLKVKSVSIGGQYRSNNIIFCDATTRPGAGELDFIECFDDILDRFDCYTYWDVCLHGHYVSVIEKAVFKRVSFSCVHYKLEELDTHGNTTGNVRYFGRLNAVEIPHEKLEGINKALLIKHKALIRNMR